MTAITQNLPGPIRDLGISLLGDEKCYVSIVEHLNFGDTPCLKLAVSKGLGIGLVVGGSIMKLPQLLLITSSRSAAGLSLPAYILETLSYAITAAYSLRHNYPFSTYGENAFLTLQNVIINFLIIAYAPVPRTHAALARKPSRAPQLLFLAFGTAISALGLALAPQHVLSYAQAATLPLSALSKLPQIAQNQRARSTGQLSAFAVFAQIAGCAARLFTNAAEVGDSLQAAGFLLALVLNVILGVQMVAFWGQGTVESRKEETWAGDEKGRLPQRSEYDQRVDVVVPPKSPVYQTGVQQPAAQPARRWARKVD
ncbi:unnamed protein product [Peniophora sp. CBMAI 1063]|nr:unnamed protein product [Peniophora sp. CBMAI 1063]